MKASSKHPRVKSSIGDASKPASSGDLTAKEYVDLTAVEDPSSSTSSDSSLHAMLDTVMTVQVVHG